MFELLSEKNLLSICLFELPIQNIISFTNCIGQHGFRFQCCNRDFSLLQEYSDKSRFELGYWTNEGLEVDRYLTPEQVADRVQALI
jgi:hypothetical protein